MQRIHMSKIRRRRQSRQLYGILIKLARVNLGKSIYSKHMLCVCVRVRAIYGTLFLFCDARSAQLCVAAGDCDTVVVSNTGSG